MDILKLIQEIDLKKLIEADKSRWTGHIRVGDSVPASTSLPTPLSISQRGLFLCLSMSGRFTTLDAGPADNGTCKLSMTMNNGSDRVYIPDPVFLDSILTPGRVKDASAAGGAAGNQLQFPGIPFVTLFKPKDIINHIVTNTAAIANTWQITYHGLWLTK